MVYLIFSGEYSDKEVHGYFTDPDDAYAFCEFYNSKEERRMMDEYYVVELEEMEVFFKERPRFHYIFKFKYYKEKYDWDGITLKNVMIFENVKTFKGGMCPNTEIKRLRDRCGSFYDISVYLKTYDKDKAFKIASDAIAKYKAEEEGI